MDWLFNTHLFISPLIASAALFLFLGQYGWRHRKMPGATPFALFTVCLVVWALAAAFEVDSVDFLTKVLWFKVQTALELPTFTLGLCFVLEFSGFARWLNRRNLALLSLFPLAATLLILTNNYHHLVWTHISLAINLGGERAVAGWVIVIYASLLFLLGTGVLIRLFVRSPLDRWPVGIIAIAQFAPWAGYLVDVAGRNPVAPLDALIIAEMIPALAYSVALFHFNVFGSVSVARGMIIDQMLDGMVVLNADNRVADLNPAAERILHLSKPEAVGSEGAEVLSRYLGQLNLDKSPKPIPEIISGIGADTRWYQVHVSPLLHAREWPLGHLIIFHDITESRRAWDRLVEQQKWHAVLEERERLARELHDSMGQALAAVQLQVEAANELASRGEHAAARNYMSRLIDMTGAAQANIREYLLGSKTILSPGENGLAGLGNYVEQFSENFGIPTELVIPSPGLDQDIDSTVGLQLVRIVQGALSNVRRHARADHARVVFAIGQRDIELRIEDDGIGFEPAPLLKPGSQAFGLHAMCERAAAIGGSLRILSTLGQGTQVVVKFPRGAKSSAGYPQFTTPHLTSQPVTEGDES